MENEFRKHLQERKKSIEDIDFAVSAIKEFEEHLKKKNTSLEFAGLEASRITFLCL